MQTDGGEDSEDGAIVLTDSDNARDAELETERVTPDRNSQAFKDFLVALNDAPVRKKNVDLDISTISDLSSSWSDDDDEDDDDEDDDEDDDDEDDEDDDLDDGSDFDVSDNDEKDENILASTQLSKQNKLPPPMTLVEGQLTLAAKVKRLFQGDMDLEYPTSAKIVRIFTSSTFTGKKNCNERALFYLQS
jgi:hypothetical protein